VFSSSERVIVDPRTVDGYAEAQARGWLPVVPSSPPSLNHGLTASRVFELVILGILGTLAARLGLGQLSSVPPVVLAVASVAVLAGWWWMFNRFVAAWFSEAVAGYVTVSPVFGKYARDRDGRWPGRSSAPKWNTDGLWLLDNKGKVLREPDRNVLPVGWYPSPNREGLFELWTGADWSYRYLPAPDERTEKTPRFGRLWTARK
jgi:hypothetical protein